ncbi:MAG: cyclohexa-1,5-dienecarbonyl-CoA hydratase [Gammaproteobacteria bacterium]|nr:cyclohexa-1,5-dienecarbonyl-CoA hydratase [Gammaproteobacteria bacterium]NIR84880.1 cyclohexa-1,5-dienecarbonyl-CoA hydratase [Gammaproteobacteria bacterium]NIR91729.1 cyclohexa-1,5-dienecarbonyl-CoA hydratase [Gammaproteobacteria bacterium]NIU05927.1 cyclohexa-1,5-dienecarbonyl-CoA hydratase [Gammaproteobacteria bacterium]NIV52974.1 cyclohexa-1,5-dienecarbonyl-CoA hydratase [Gammaproteobacteria bacterium]
MSGPVVKVWLEHGGRLLRVRLARPKANVVDAEMTAALESALVEHAALRDLGAVVLDAEGPSFSYGASVEEHLPESCARMLRGLHSLVLHLVAYPVPVLTAVRGQCLGGGLEVALAAHRIFAAPDAKLGQPEIQLGVFAPAASCLLPERVARAAAEDLLFSGRIVSGEEAHHIGLVDALATDPEGAALEYFHTHLAPRSASSLRFAVRAVRDAWTRRIAERLEEVERLYLNELMATCDAVEGLEAFLAKRPAKWENA